MPFLPVLSNFPCGLFSWGCGAFKLPYSGNCTALSKPHVNCCTDMVYCVNKAAATVMRVQLQTCGSCFMSSQSMIESLEWKLGKAIVLQTRRKGGLDCLGGLLWSYNYFLLLTTLNSSILGLRFLHHLPQAQGGVNGSSPPFVLTSLLWGIEDYCCRWGKEMDTKLPRKLHGSAGIWTRIFWV